MKRIIKTVLLILIIAFAEPASAQLNPMGSLYFQNQYLGNPAMAGSEAGLNLNLGYRKQWSSIPGSPATQTLTGDYMLNEKVGLGLNIYNDKAGLFKRTRTVASYAYHLPLSTGGDQQLSFGLSLGFMNERISNESLHGDANDVNVGNYNDRNNYIDGDFGIVYANKGFSIQAALPNMKSFFKKDLVSSSVDRATFFSAASYKIILSEGATGFGLEPKLVYRGVNGFQNIIDAGANISYAENKISVFGIYHTSNSSTFGIRMNYQSIGFSAMYTSATSVLSSYANGDFEISMKINLLK